MVVLGQSLIQPTCAVVMSFADEFLSDTYLSTPVLSLGMRDGWLVLCYCDSSVCTRFGGAEGE